MSDIKLKTTADLRAFLLDEMIETANGRREATTAKAVCNYAQQVYNTINLEMRHAHARNKYGIQNLSPVTLDGSGERSGEIAAPADDFCRLGKRKPS